MDNALSFLPQKWNQRNASERKRGGSTLKPVKSDDAGEESSGGEPDQLKDLIDRTGLHDKRIE